MIQNTRRLFLALLRALEIDTVCDVGSMDGSDALAFRRVLPRARVQAFEANPRNACLMQSDARLREQRVEVVPLAVTNLDGESDFHLVKAEYATANHRRGMSSLLKREDERLRDSVVVTRTARLDTVLAPAGARKRRIALWIDVEGMACEAIEGATGVLDELVLLHVEVETTPCIGATQRLFPELDQWLRAAGFARLATDHPLSFEQFNAVFVRRDLKPAERRRVLWHSLRLGVRSGLVRALVQICPGCATRIMRLIRKH